MQGRYKKSVFNIIIDELSGGEALVFNSFHSTFGIMDTATRSIYERIENTDPASLEEGRDREAFSILFKNGLTVLKLRSPLLQHYPVIWHVHIALSKISLVE